MVPLFDIKCLNCEIKSEDVYSYVYEKIRCPVCTSRLTERLWTGPPVIIMPVTPEGSTRGVRLKAQEITRKEAEKARKRSV